MDIIVRRSFLKSKYNVENDKAENIIFTSHLTLSRLGGGVCIGKGGGRSNGW